MNQTYEKADLLIPSYISTLPSPIRRRHTDNLLVSKSQARPEMLLEPYQMMLKMSLVLLIDGEFYNAWEEDIALVNIFFGKDTVMGEQESWGLA